MKKVGDTARSFLDDLNQILYDYTVEVTNRFKGSDLVRVSENYDLEHCTGGGDQNHPQEKQM